MTKAKYSISLENIIGITTTNTGIHTNYIATNQLAIMKYNVSHHFA